MSKKNGGKSNKQEKNEKVGIVCNIFKKIIMFLRKNFQNIITLTSFFSLEEKTINNFSGINLDKLLEDKNNE